MIQYYCPRFFILFYFFLQFNFILIRTDKDCNPANFDSIDLLFVIDGSQSVTQENFDKMKEFLKQVVQSLKIGPNDTQVGLLQYATENRVEFSLNKYNERGSLLQAINNIEYLDQFTYTGSAIQYSAKELFLPENGGRKDKARVMVVITDGESWDEVKAPSDYARNVENIQIIAVGVTDGVEEETLNKIVGSEHLDRKMILTDFENFKETLDTLRLKIKRSANEDCYKNIDPPTVTEILGLDDSEQKIMTCKRENISEESSTQESDPCYVSLESQDESAKTTYSVNLGEDVTLKCLATGETESEIRLKWFKRHENFDQETDKDEDLTKWVPLTGSLPLSDAKFTLPDIKRENTGVYKCLAENAVGKTHSMNIQINVTVDCVTDRQKITKNVGDSVSLNCPKVGGSESHAIKFNWIYGATKNFDSCHDLNFEDNIQIAGENADITLKNLQPEHTGEYTCSVSYSRGYRKIIYELDVLLVDCTIERHEIVKYAGESVTLNCPKVDGSENHVQKFSWIHGATKNLGTCNDLNVTKNVQTISEDADITLTDLKPVDAREYTCTVSYGKGFRQITHELDVIECDIKHEKVVEKIGQNVTLKCPTVSSSDETFGLKYVWETEAPKSLNSCENIDILEKIESVDADFTLKNLTLDHQARNYTCTLYYGKSSKRIINELEVLYPPAVPLAFPQHQQMHGNEKESFTLPCPVKEAGGNPSPQVYWTKDGKNLTTNLYNEETGNLTLENLSDLDTGKYTCFVWNSEGQIHFDNDFEVYYRPVIDDDNETFIEMVRKRRSRIQQHLRNGQEETQNRIDKGQNANEKIVPSPIFAKLLEEDQNVGQESTLKILQSTYTVLENGSVTLECFAFGIPLPNVKWMKLSEDSTKFVPFEEETVNVTSDVGSSLAFSLLKLDNVKLSHNGTYKCVAENTVGQSENERQIDLIVHSPPRFHGSQKIGYFGYENETFILDSPVSGNPRPKVFWGKTSEKFLKLNETPGYKVLENGSLEISRLVGEHNADFFCYAENIAGNSTLEINLKVGIAPKVDLKLDLPVIVKGNQFKAKCNVLKGNPAPKIRWFKGRKLISGPNKRIRFENDQSLLIIDNVERKDEGNYACEAENNVNGSYSMSYEQSASLTVHELPYHPIDVQQKYIIKEQKSVLMKCPFNGNPSPSVSWFKGEVQLAENDPEIKIHEDHGATTLEILDVKESQKGSYACKANNSVGSSTLLISLDVLVPPILKDSQRQLKIKQGENLTVECVAVRGSPKPKVLWFKDDKVVENFNNMEVSKQGELIITNIKREDKGLYTCEAQNCVSTTKMDVNIDVLVPPTITTPKTTMTRKTLDITQNLELSCKAGGYPTPNITWFHNETEIRPSEKITADHSLIVKETSLEDSGFYTCKAVNEAGETTAKFEINIRSEPPNISIDVKDDLIIVKGQSKVVKCTASGIPEPSVSWTRNGEKISESGILHLNNVAVNESEANYECVAQNIIADDSKALKIVVHDPPRILTGVPNSWLLTEGETKTLECKASGKPDPKIVWKRRGQVISENGVLELKNVQLDVAGPDYTCEAQNIAGTKSKSMTILVQKTPDAEPVNIESEQEALGFKVVTSHALDLMIVLDSSKSLPVDEFENVKAFTSRVISRLPIGPNDVRVGLVQFESIPSGVLNLTANRETILKSVLKSAGDVERLGGGTVVGAAISYTAEKKFELAKGDRPQGTASRVILLVTDGHSNSKITPDLHGILKKKGIDLIAVSSFESNSPASYRQNFDSTIGRQYNPDHVFQFRGLGSDREVVQKIIDLSRISIHTKKMHASDVLPKCHVQSAGSAPRKCSRAAYSNLDLSILLDDSQRTNGTMFDKMKVIIELVAYHLTNDGHPGNARISLSTFNEEAKLWFDLDKYVNNWYGMARAIRAVTKTDKKKVRHMPAAVRTVIKQLWKEPVAQKPRFMLIMTGGYVNIREAKIDKWTKANEVTPIVVHHRHSDPSKEPPTQRKYDLSYSSTEEIDNNLLKNILKDIRRTIDDPCYEMIFENKDNNCEN